MKKMLHIKLSAALLLCLLVTQSALALQVTGLYSHRVAVANESDSERDRAFSEAMAAVLLKVTGEQRWLQHPVIRQAIEDAQNYVEAISYSSETVLLPTEEIAEEAAAELEDPVAGVNNPPSQPLLPASIEQRYIDIDFAATLIDEVLTSADIPVWDSNRPSVLVWMVLQNDAGERTMLTADSNPEILALLQEFAAQRGLPIIFPLLDFEDRRNLSENTVWTLDQELISSASERYGADSVLSGRLHFTAGGELVGLWQFIFQDQAEVFDGFDTDLQPYLYEPLNRITAQLANYFAIVPEATAQQFVRLRVEGIKDLTAYSALMSYVSSLSLVESVAPAELDGERLELRLGLVGDTQQLFELIELDRDLLPIQSSLSGLDDDLASGSESLLHYRWTR